MQRSGDIRAKDLSVLDLLPRMSRVHWFLWHCTIDTEKKKRFFNCLRHVICSAKEPLVPTTAVVLVRSQQSQPVKNQSLIRANRPIQILS